MAAPANWRTPSRRPSAKERDNRARRANLSGKFSCRDRPMPDRILVINPNSTDAVTRAIDDAMAALRITGGPGIDCVTLREGPPGVESQSDADAVIAPLCRAIGDAEPETAAFVIACFSDPGLFSAREATGKPVLGTAAPALHRGDGSGAAARRRSADRPWGLRTRRWPQDAVAHDRKRLPT